MRPDFEKNGLVPAVVQDARSGQVRMLGYMDEEAYGRTLETRELHLFSRARGRLWKKGETSGHLHAVLETRLDCDRDAVLVLVETRGPTCHTGSDSCFGGEPLGIAHGALARLETVVRDRLEKRPHGSYTARLAAAGTPRITQKVGEEAVEVVVAALAQDKAALASESADLLYHLLVLWADRGLTLDEVIGVLDRRAGGGP